MNFDESQPGQYLELLLVIAEQFGRKALLIPTSDVLAAFVVQHASILKNHYIFPHNEESTILGLISKKGMYELAMKCGVPVPKTLFPQVLDDVINYAKEVTFPVMLKAIYGHNLFARTGKKMVLVHSREELVRTYLELEDQSDPNLMIQEYIPGGDDQVYIFNGYFDSKSNCLAAFTGRKIRQYPIHTGAASLGECCWNEKLSEITIKFMSDINYQGILDIGYRLDPRDGQFKVLDVNPRVGQAFRIFVSENNNDVVVSQYLDLTGQEVGEIIPREGWRWIIEDRDIVSSFHYYKEKGLNLSEWYKSLYKIQEVAWFSVKDPIPVTIVYWEFIKKVSSWPFRLLNSKLK